MGVRGLETFVKTEIINGVKNVNIAQEIQSYKTNHKKNPIIIVDFMALCNTQQHQIELLCGGRCQILLKRIKVLFDLIKDAGAELIFFSDGAVVEGKKISWLNRREDDYKEMLIILNEIKAGKSVTEILSTRPNFSMPTTIQFPVLRCLAEKYGEFRVSMEYECDIDIAKYAKENDAFAILADDTDFLIYEGNFHYWNLHTADLTIGTIDQFNKKLLRQQLGLKETEMPLFAVLVGNDVTNRTELLSFHRKLGKNSEKFQKIANIVKNFPPDDLEKNVFVLINKFIDSKNPFDLAIRIQKGIKFYDVKTHQFYQEEDPFHAKLLGEKEFLHYSILKNQPLSHRLTFQDLRKRDLKHSSVIFVETFKKVMGVFAEHLHDKKPRIIYTKLEHNIQYSELSVYPKKLPMEIPDLNTLIFGPETEDIHNTRWDIFNFIFEGIFTFDVVSEMDPRYIPVVAALVYLVDKGGLDVKEADRLLFSFHHMINKWIPENLKAPMYLSERNIRVMFLFLDVYNLMYMVLHTIGLQKYAVLTGFDGMAYHVVSELWSDLEPEDTLAMVQDLKEYRLYDDEYKYVY